MKGKRLDRAGRRYLETGERPKREGKGVLVLDYAEPKRVPRHKPPLPPGTPIVGLCVHGLRYCYGCEGERWPTGGEGTGGDAA